jgi:hypothetical protein
MRINILCAMALFCAVYANAQKNTWMVYGSGSYDTKDYMQSQAAMNSTPYQQSSSPLTLDALGGSAGVGFNISDHFMVGLQGGYSRQEQIYGGYNYYAASTGYVNYYAEDKYQQTNWTVGVFGRYTSWVTKRIFVYSQLYAGKYGVNYKWLGTESVYGPQAYTTASPEIPDGNGFVVNLFPAVGMEVFKGYGIHMDLGGISYTSYKSGTTDADLHHFNVTLGSQFSFGIHKIIGWKKYSAKQQAATPGGK